MTQARAILFLIALLAQGQNLHSANSDPAGEEYIHDVWDARRGFPANAVHAIAGTHDGYLWIGTERGLVRFDGSAFRLFDHSNTPVLPSGPIVQLKVSKEGDLWIRTQEFSPIRLRSGLFSVQPLVKDGASRPGTVIVQLGDGDLFLPSLANDAFVYHAGVLRVLQLKIPQPNVIVADAVGDGTGNLWLATRDSGLYYRSGEGRVSEELKLRDRKINCLVRADNGDLWIGTESGLVRRGQRNQTLPVPAPLKSVPVHSIIRDHAGKIWVGTRAGLARIDEQGQFFAFFTDTPVNSLYEDREGGIWLGASKGLERLRESIFVTHETADGSGGPICSDAANNLWSGAGKGGLVRAVPGGLRRVSVAGLDKEMIYSIGGGTDLWLGTRTGSLLRVNVYGKHPQVTFRRKFREGSIFSVHRSRDGSVWVGFVNGGVGRLSQGVFHAYNVTDGLPSNAVSSILEAGTGDIWFATANGLARFSEGSWKAFRGQEGLPSARLNCLFEDSEHVLWIGTSQGPLFLRNGRFESPAPSSPLLNEDAVGITEDAARWIWIATTEHIFRVRREKLLNGTISENDIFNYGPQDGLASTKGIRRDRSVVSDGIGRIWFSTEAGVSSVDPGRLTPETAPAIVHLQDAIVDGTPFATATSLKLPSSARRVIFSFTGLSLSAPERVRYRYRLDNFDRGWSMPTPVREAAYTNLPPGKYSFHVLACNSEGFWNSAEASASLEIEPAFWQTSWFYAAVIAVTAMAFSGAYRYRLAHLTGQLNMRFEERLAERTRIAQELHDTLLQGVISASMQLHVAVDRLPVDSPLCRLMGGILELMREVIDEGRNTVRGLRSSGPGDDLAQAFSTIHREEFFSTDIAIRIVVDGSPRPLHPILRDEVYRIGREALINALRHSRAKGIEVTLDYTGRPLVLRIRDNGRGIDPEVLRNGRDGHWGLPGMRERADRIGARFHLWSQPGLGTEIELSVPGHLAYQTETIGMLRPKPQTIKKEST